ncbi:putative receptor-like protein kinase At4g00960 [Coffea eugenioides]|uniref:putative receptor-like protein kinase At4g00960 n=1 Tax=Coffea eugenioides TaxID=49369 RepID=UPI000F611EAD|nr:putative receptor-like protein kinase At4g00960 [Coffea eugenioides]
MPSFEMISRNLLFHFKYYMLCLLSFHTIEYCCSTSSDTSPWNYLDSYCGNITYNSGSIYRTNLNFLLDNLSSHASRTDNNGFYNFSTGDDPSNKVYGLFLCRGDVNTDVCKECVADAHTRLLQECPNQTAAIVWYDECLLRFSDQTIFSRADLGENLTRRNPFDVPGPDWDKFKMVLINLLHNAVDKAANHTTGKKFAVEEGNYSTDQKRLYTLTQCTPDLSPYDCKRCLTEAIIDVPACCSKKQGGRVIYPSCNLRYEVSSFYDTVSSASPNSPGGKGRSPPRAAFSIAVPLIGVAVVLFVMALVFLKRRLRKSYVAMAPETSDGVAEILTAESLQYSLTETQIATNNFSVDNKIGEGGFGRVYKGVLANGQEVAVKRLSRSSGQGAEEFKNEIVVVAKLQHRNLFRLLGFCLEGEEKILVYEFVPNRSLDYFLFDSEQKRSLNWSRRYKIIGGIARGLLYLHEDSRLRIIHRDLKASNILLDGNMSPKIADFGMAKICGVDQSVGNTNRIAGTFGYMAPEYTRCGQFSVKSDVFSFGVVILEIITGKKNSSFYVSEDSEGLLSYAWKHWRSGDPLALLDSSIGDSYIKNEVIQCVQVGLVCVEEDVSKRPTMASVVQMLNNSSVTLPTPHCPAVFRSQGSEGRVEELEVEQSNTERISAPSSVNGASITEPYPR